MLCMEGKSHGKVRPISAMVLANALLAGLVQLRLQRLRLGSKRLTLGGGALQLGLRQSKRLGGLLHSLGRHLGA